MLQAKSRKFKDKSDQQETALLDLTASLDECKGLHDALKKQLDAAHDEIAQHTETEARLKEEIEATKTLATTAKEEARKAKEENAYILFIISPFHHFTILLFQYYFIDFGINNKIKFVEKNSPFIN